MPKEKENLRHECNCDFAFLPRRIRACRNCDCRLVLCTAVSFILLLEYMTVNVCERLFCVGVSQKEISCLFFFSSLFLPSYPFVNGCDIPAAAATFSIIQSFSINISLCQSASRRVSVREWQSVRRMTHSGVRQTASLQPALNFEDISRSFNRENKRAQPRDSLV